MKRAFIISLFGVFALACSTTDKQGADEVGNVDDANDDDGESDGDSTGFADGVVPVDEEDTGVGDTQGPGEDSDEGGSSDDGPSSFIQKPDGGGVSMECDQWTQDCPDGEKCVPYPSSGGSWDANKCVAVMGAQAVGEPCVSGGWVEATDDCDETSFCWDVREIDGEWIGVCHALCTGYPDSPQCPESSYCAVAGGGVIVLCIPMSSPSSMMSASASAKAAARWQACSVILSSMKPAFSSSVVISIINWVISRMYQAV